LNFNLAGVLGLGLGKEKAPVWRRFW